MDSINATDGKRRSLIAAYALWFFLGSFGAHRFYMGRQRSGTIMLLLSLLGWLLVSSAWWRAGSTIAADRVAGEGFGDTLLRVLMAPGTLLGWIGDLILLGVLIWWLVDAALVYVWVRQHNAEPLIPANIMASVSPAAASADATPPAAVVPPPSPIAALVPRVAPPPAPARASPRPAGDDEPNIV